MNVNIPRENTRKLCVLLVRSPTAMGKGQKKKAQTLSLAEFAADKAAEGNGKEEPDDMIIVVEPDGEGPEFILFNPNEDKLP